MRLSELQHALPALSDVEKAALAETLRAGDYTLHLGGKQD